MAIMSNNGNRIIVLGAGLGGLLSGFLLSKEGKQVIVLEKYRKFGGCLQNFKRDTYSFDTGMHYLGSMAPGQSLSNYWKYFGLTDNLDLLKMDENGFDRISYLGTEYPIAQGFDNFREQLHPYFPDEQSALKKYTDNLQEIVDSHPLYNLELPQGSYTDHDQSILASSYLSDLTSGIQYPASGIRLSDILAGNNFLYAGNPATTPLSEFGLINHSFISSAWRIAGGSQQLADILVKGIEANGGKVLGKKDVVKINKKGEYFHVTTEEGELFEADQVISAIHPSATLELLEGISVQKAYKERIQSLSNSVSVFSIYLGLKPKTFPFLNHNLYHYSTDNIWSGLPLQGDEWPKSFLFMTPPEKDQGEFATTAIAMATMHYDELSEWEESNAGGREKAYFVFKAKKAKKLLDLVYQKFPELKDAVATIEISTPLTWRDYTGTPKGSMYGVIRDATNPQKNTVLPKTKVPGLYFTGQNINLQGALGVTIGAVMTCGEILGLPYVLNKIRDAC